RTRQLRRLRRAGLEARRPGQSPQSPDPTGDRAALSCAVASVAAPLLRPPVFARKAPSPVARGEWVGSRGAVGLPAAGELRPEHRISHPSAGFVLLPSRPVGLLHLSSAATLRLARLSVTTRDPEPATDRCAPP